MDTEEDDMVINDNQDRFTVRGTNVYDNRYPDLYCPFITEHSARITAEWFNAGSQPYRDWTWRSLGTTQVTDWIEWEDED